MTSNEICDAIREAAVSVAVETTSEIRGAKSMTVADRIAEARHRMARLEQLIRHSLEILGTTLKNNHPVVLDADLTLWDEFDSCRREIDVAAQMIDPSIINPKPKG